MAGEIPAWQRSSVGKESVHAGLWLRRIEDELSLSVLLEDCVVMVHRDRSEGISIGGNPDAKNREVESECENGRSQDEQKDPKKDSPESLAKFLSRDRCHEADYIPERDL
jgi:hypothetical protein